MQTKFTPAPWIFKPTAQLTCEWTFDFKKMNLGSSISKEQFDANTSLIAVAPEMYELLDSCLREMRQLIDEVNGQLARRTDSLAETDPDCHDHETLHLIDKLLSKARGE